MTDLSAEVERLRERNAALEYLLDELTGGADPELMDLDVTRSQRRIVGAMLRTPGKPVSKAQLVAAYHVENPESDWPMLDTVDAHICNIRRRLAGIIKVETHWGYGYSATRTIEETPA